MVTHLPILSKCQSGCGTKLVAKNRKNLKKNVRLTPDCRNGLNRPEAFNAFAGVHSDAEAGKVLKEFDSKR